MTKDAEPQTGSERTNWLRAIGLGTLAATGIGTAVFLATPAPAPLNAPPARKNPLHSPAIKKGVELAERIREFVEEERKKAEAEGKPLLLVVDNHHESPASALVALLIQEQMRKDHMPFVVECPPAQLQAFLRRGSYRKSLDFITLAAHMEGLQVIAADSDKIISEAEKFLAKGDVRGFGLYGLEHSGEREATMAETAARYKNAALFTGYMHTPGVEDALKKTHHVAVINTFPITEEAISGPKEARYEESPRVQEVLAKQAKGVRMIRDRQDVLHLDFPLELIPRSGANSTRYDDAQSTAYAILSAVKEIGRPAAR